MPKLAQILKRSSGSRQVCVSVFFFSDHCIKQIDSMLPWVCSVIDHRGRQNVVKTKMCANHTKRVRTEKNNSATQDVRRSSAHWFILLKIFTHF